MLAKTIRHPYFLYRQYFCWKALFWWSAHTRHTSNTPPTHLQHTSAAHRSELRAILFASSSKPYCLQKVEIKFILMLLLRSALARCVVGVFLISQLHAWTTFCLFCYISDHKVCFRQYVRRVSHISLVNSEYRLSTRQIRVRVLARRFELGDARPNCWQLISFSPHHHDRYNNNCNLSL